MNEPTTKKPTLLVVVTKGELNRRLFTRKADYAQMLEFGQAFNRLQAWCAARAPKMQSNN